MARRNEATVLSIRRPEPLDVPGLITWLQDNGQSFTSIAKALGIARGMPAHWKAGRAVPRMEDCRALLVLKDAVAKNHNGES